jgi:hypothetical protein
VIHHTFADESLIGGFIARLAYGCRSRSSASEVRVGL